MWEWSGVWLDLLIGFGRRGKTRILSMFGWVTRWRLLPFAEIGIRSRNGWAKFGTCPLWK